MISIANIEVGLEIDHELENELMKLDQHYIDGLITREEMASKAALLIHQYLMVEELVLIKIIKPAN